MVTAIAVVNPGAERLRPPGNSKEKQAIEGVGKEANRRDGRVVEGAPLLREYRVKSLIEGSNPSLSASQIK